jgi:hypothetical protein
MSLGVGELFVVEVVVVAESFVGQTPTARCRRAEKAATGLKDTRGNSFTAHHSGEVNY